jgi:two-component system, cell cycle response regulator DivK
MAHILIIEDYRDNRDMTELILDDAGHSVSTAGDGVSGVWAAASIKPDLILMDLALPGLDGWEATRLLKANPQTSHIPVVAFTAQVDEEALTRAVDAGCIAVIAKPFQLDDLLDHITAVLARYPRPAKERALGE